MSARDRHTVRIMHIDAAHHGQRLDNYLLGRLKGVPRSHIYRIVRTGQVRINKSRVRPSYRLQDGDQVRIPPLRLPRRLPLPPAGLGTDWAKHTLFEDECLWILDKPAGLAVHAGSGVTFGLIERLRCDRPDSRFLELVHRLDRDTSGCLLIAKKRSALTRLHEDLRQTSVRSHRVKKRYLALVRGHWPASLREIDAPLRKNAVRAGERRAVVDERGRSAKTRFRPLTYFRDATLVEIVLFTGRTHQARVHAASAGYPIAGDGKYGDWEFNARLAAIGLNRLFLHAASLSFRHPTSGARVTVEAPLPEALLTTLEGLEPA
ncbi:MAG: RluA family pseudouridine synthase [Gammaproteobacteria bacterium]|nr:RluA family pseudouridine synthase [Gammaproteobacteria bacterium]